MRVSRANLIFWSIWSFLFVWCYFNSFDDPSSIFYKPDKAIQLRFSAVRVAEVDEYVQQWSTDTASAAKPVETSTPGTSESPFLCIGIPSINRTTHAFLVHTVGSLVDTLSPDERASIHIVVLLADRDPGHHSAYGQPWLNNLVDDVVVYEPADSELHHDEAYRVIPFDVRGAGRGDGRVENMRLDHSVLVESCRNRGSQYFALVEDDVIASRNWFTKVKKGLQAVESQSQQSGNDWIYLRMFYSEFFMGWNNEEVFGYLETIALIYIVIILVFLELRRRRRQRATPSSSGKGASTQAFNYIAALALGLWTPALIALFFMAGRISMHRLNLFNISGVREMPRYGCCAQGLVFPRRQLEGLQTLFREPPYDFPGDMILEGWAGDHGLRKFALDPSVLQHVGLIESSDGPRRAEVWNFSFERSRG